MSASGFNWRNRQLLRTLYSTVLRSGRDWEREVLRGSPVLAEQQEIHMLVFGLPQRVIARLPDSLSLSGRTLTQLIPI
ncbi:uncharacterized protein ACA1_099360, partial [Acanthamoeba castellanii str. Neff]